MIDERQAVDTAYAIARECVAVCVEYTLVLNEALRASFEHGPGGALMGGRKDRFARLQRKLARLHRKGEAALELVREWIYMSRRDEGIARHKGKPAPSYAELAVVLSRDLPRELPVGKEVFGCCIAERQSKSRLMVQKGEELEEVLAEMALERQRVLDQIGSVGLRDASSREGCWEVTHGEVHFVGSLVNLKGAPRHLLRHFVERAGRDLSYEYLADFVLGDPGMQTESVQKNVSRLKVNLRKLDHPELADAIHTVTGAYVLVLPRTA